LHFEPNGGNSCHVKTVSYQNGRQIHPIVVQLICAAIVLSVYFHIRINLIEVPLNRDEGGFAFFGRLIAEGGMPYRDAVDHKPPGIWFIYAMMSRIVPLTATGLHWALHIYNLVTLALLGFLCRRVFDPKAAFWTMFIFAVASSGPEFEGFSGSAEVYMLLPIVASLLLCILGHEKGSGGCFFFAGMVSAASFWIKQPALAVTAFLGGYIFLSCPKSEGSRIVIIRLTLFAFGFLLLSAFVLIWIVTNGVWEEFVYWAFRHNLEYAGSAGEARFLERLRIQIPFMIESNPFLWIAALGGCIVRAADRRPKGWFASGFLLSSLVAALHSPALYRHYFALACPALALAAGAGVSRTMRWWENKRWLRPGVALAVIFLIAGIPLAQYKGYYFSFSPHQISRMMFGSNPFPEATAAAEYLARQTDPDNSILVLGSEPQILVLANRPSASRHPFVYPVVGQYRRAKEFQEQVVQDLENSRPEYVVVVQHAQSWMADPQVSRSLLNRIYGSLGNRYHLDALIVSGNEFVTLIDCKIDGAACISAMAPKGNDGGKRIPAMLLYRKGDSLGTG